MTQATLTLVSNNPVLIPPAEPSGPTEQEKLVIAEYVKDFIRRGFCKIDDEACKQTELLNRFNRKRFQQPFMENDFIRWLDANDKECKYISARYMMRKLYHVAGTIFTPIDEPYITEQDTGCTFVNTYKKYKPRTNNTNVSDLFFECLERLAPIPEERHILVQWLSHIFQRPEVRPSWHIMLPSDTGTGKGFLMESVLHPLLTHTQILNSYSKLTSQFSTTLEENLLVLLDDAKAGSDAQQTQLKSLLSEERAYVERKRLQGGMVKTYTRFILASNEDTPLDLDANERRWYVLSKVSHKVDGDETAEFIKALDEWLDLPGSLDAVYHYFMTYSLDGFNPKRVMQSTTLLQMVKRSKSVHAQILERFIVDNPVFTTRQLMGAYAAEGLSCPSTKQIPALLSSISYENTHRTIAGSKIHICHPVDMPLETIRALYKPAMY